MKINDTLFIELLELSKTKEIYLSGDIVKHLVSDNDEQDQYFKKCIEVHKKSAKERFAVSQKALIQNDQLKKQQSVNQKLVVELTARNQELHLEKEKTSNILTLVKKDKENVEVKLKLMESEKKFDIMAKALNWILILVAVIIIGIITIYLSHLFLGKDMEVVSNQVFTILSNLMIASISIVSALFGVKSLQEKHN